MSVELLNMNQANTARTFEDDFSIVKEELFNCFLEWMWEEKSNWSKILAMFWMILARFDKESLKIAKNDLIEFIWTFLREMEIDEVNIRIFQRKYLKYLVYKTAKDTADRVIEKMSRKERSI